MSIPSPLYLPAAGCSAPLDLAGSSAVIVVSCALGLAWALYNYKLVKRISLSQHDMIDLDDVEDMTQNLQITVRQKKLLLQLGDKISQGAKQFLKDEYSICLIFVAIMAVIIYFLTPDKLFTSIAFVIGALISILCGSIGMVIATQTNYRTTFCAKKSLSEAFRVAYRAGCSMGFALVSIGLVILMILILVFKRIKGLDDYSMDRQYYGSLFEGIAGYGLGGSFVALFGRVGGGIYTKAADVGADLVGKVESGLPQDSPKNPATIADNVGDNVGDVAGMSADLFGSFAQSTCAALVLSSTSLVSTVSDDCPMYIANILYPLMLIALGIILCILVSSLGTHFMKVETLDKVQKTLKMQLIISTVLLVGVIYLAAAICYPTQFKLILDGAEMIELHPYYPYVCSICGLVSGMMIAAFTEYVTSHSYMPVRELAKTCAAGAASNVTLGLALGYFSTFFPVVFIALTAFVSNKIMGYYGVSLAALGMLSNLPLSLAIDGYGPISDNAGGIAEMAEMGPQVREITDGLDAAGNTTAAIGKGFAIGSAALVSLSLYGGFLHNANLQNSSTISLSKPQIFTGMILGAMLPYLFSAFTIRSVGKAAFGMVQQVRRQIRQNPGILQGTVQPDYKACIRISTRASLRQMIAPGCLVIFTPLALGFIFGPVMVAGFLPGAIVSGVQMAISAANTGGAWDNAKKYIQAGGLFDEQGNQVRKGSDIHKAAVVGDTVGDPLKDTSGPALNILIKLMAILSLVFAAKFAQYHPAQ